MPIYLIYRQRSIKWGNRVNDKESIRVAVVDDGINEKLFSLGCLDANLAISSELAVDTRRDYNAFLPSHGTTCAAIIKKYAPDVNLISIKILNDSSRRSEKHQLITAIEWCVDNGIKLVNLSLGTVDFRDFDEIKYCVNKAFENDLIIVAACNNKNIYTVPSCLTNVIGVRCRKIYTNAQYRFIPYPFNGIDAEASGRHMLTDIYGNSRYTSPANSFAAPLVTAMVYKILMRNSGIVLEEIKEELYKDALNFTDNGYDPCKCMNADWLEKGAKLDKCTGCYYQSVRSTGQKKRKVWNPELYKIQLTAQLNKKQANVDIPVIAIYNEGNCDILSGLHMLFRNEGYYSIKISEDYTDIPNGCEYMPEGTPVIDFISLVYKKYFCDIILLKINDRKFIDDNSTKKLFDIIVHIDTDKITYIYADGVEAKSVTLTVVKGKEDEQIKNVFERMLKILQEA